MQKIKFKLHFKHFQETQRLKMKGRTKKLKTVEENDLDTSLANVWKLLEVESNSTGFLITHHGYNFFHDETKDWLKRKDVQSWNTNELMRAKCNEWLKSVK